MIILIILIILVLLSFNLFRNLFKNDVTILDDVKLKESEPSNNGFALMLQQDDGTYEESNNSLWPIDMVFNSEKSGCIDINGNKIEDALSFDTTNNLVNVSVGETAYCYLYFDKDNSVYAKVVSDYTNGNGVSKLSDSDKGSRTYDTYYYTGNITNNNVLYADHCWKMVITTEGNGVKMIYNGVPIYTYSSIDKISQSEYNVSTNTPSDYPFIYDSSTNEWTSGIAGQNSTTNTIEFTVATAGDYVLSYSVSSVINNDYVFIYKNGTILKGYISGTVRGLIDLSGLTTSDVIKVIYAKNSSSSSGSDTVTFGIGTPVGKPITTSCNNTGTDSHIEATNTKFNSSDNSPAYVGYMYNKVYTVTEKSMSSDTTAYVYGNSITWDGSNYTLVNTKSGAWSSVYSSLSNNHYTCFTTGTTCSSVYYIDYASNSYVDYLTLTGGVNIEEALNEMLHAEDVNKIDSTIKAKIDSWYESNLLNTTDSEGNLYSSYLQNTIYCNNRIITDLGPFNPNGGSDESYSSLGFNYNTLDCANKTDQFTLSVDKGGTEGYGNNALKYPIGLISYKEASLARNGSSTNYLKDSSYFRLFSPSGFYKDYALVSFMPEGIEASSSVEDYYSGGVRPAVTLSSIVKIKSGDGSVDSPFIVGLA